MKNCIVFVLGMHRSGTSMLTHMVEQAGYHCGDNLQPPGSDNPNGYFEDLAVLKINETLLRSLGKDWSSLGVPELSDLQKLACYSELKLQAVAYLSQQLDKHSRLVVKDPRLCILLPFWLTVAKELDARTKFLIIKRDAASIVQSLHKRDLMDPVYAMQLVLCYWTQIAYCVVTDAHDWGCVDYESISSLAQRSQLAEKLGGFLEVDNQRILNALAHYKAELNHAKKTQAALPTICFDFQRPFSEAFPCVLSQQDFIQCKALAFIHQSLSFWGDTQAVIQKISQSSARLNSSLKQHKVVIYGAGSVAKLIIGHVFSKVICGVDQALTEKTSLLNIDFFPISYLQSLEDATVLVTVTGRKQAIQANLAAFKHKVVFIEDYFNDHANY